MPILGLILDGVSWWACSFVCFLILLYNRQVMIVGIYDSIYWAIEIRWRKEEFSKRFPCLLNTILSTPFSFTWPATRLSNCSADFRFPPAVSCLVNLEIGGDMEVNIGGSRNVFIKSIFIYLSYWWFWAHIKKCPIWHCLNRRTRRSWRPGVTPPVSNPEANDSRDNLSRWGVRMRVLGCSMGF